MFLVRNMFLVKDTPQTQYWRGFAADWARCFSVKARCFSVKARCFSVKARCFSVKARCFSVKAACTNVKRPALTSSGLH